MSFSSFQNLPPHTSLSSSLNLAEKFKSEDELVGLRRQVRQKEAEFAKEKALLEQKVELL